MCVCKPKGHEQPNIEIQPLGNERLTGWQWTENLKGPGSPQPWYPSIWLLQRTPSFKTCSHGAKSRSYPHLVCQPQSRIYILIVTHHVVVHLVESIRTTQDSLNVPNIVSLGSFWVFIFTWVWILRQVLCLTGNKSTLPYGSLCVCPVQITCGYVMMRIWPICQYVCK